VLLPSRRRLLEQYVQPLRSGKRPQSLTTSRYGPDFRCCLRTHTHRWQADVQTFSELLNVVRTTLTSERANVSALEFLVSTLRRAREPYRKLQHLLDTKLIRTAHASKRVKRRGWCHYQQQVSGLREQLKDARSRLLEAVQIEELCVVATSASTMSS
jgi:hypothetical protein